MKEILRRPRDSNADIYYGFIDKYKYSMLKTWSGNPHRRESWIEALINLNKEFYEEHDYLRTIVGFSYNNNTGNYPFTIFYHS